MSKNRLKPLKGSIVDDQPAQLLGDEADDDDEFEEEDEEEELDVDEEEDS